MFTTANTSVAIQGQQASFHDIAARLYFGKSISPIACETFADTFHTLKTKKSDYAVVALENSLFGSINEVYDLLLKHKFWISGEIYLRVEQCLLGLPGTKLKSVREVYSHPVALAQCDKYLEDKLPFAKRFEHHDTGGAAEDVKRWEDPTKTAIASHLAAEMYDLEILDRSIETHKQNYTRFVILTKTRQDVESADKTSLILETADKPGALYHALGAFARQNINLTKLQSRPIIGRAWQYMFYTDVNVGIADPSLELALRELSDQDCDVTILGSYVAGR